MELFIKMISASTGIKPLQIDHTLNLLNEGATIPYISRYRKEATGGLDEVQIEQEKNQYDKLCEISQTKQTILGTIDEQGKLTDDLKKRIEASWDLTALEDIYLLYKQQPKPLAQMVRQHGP